MASAARSISPQPRGRYVPPAATSTITSAEAGFTNGFALKVPTLYLAGERELLRQKSVAIVGSRKASPDGLRRAERLARELVARGIVIMSGLAEGIDQAAHRAAIAAHGRTVAVIGTPLTKAYPAAHAQLQIEIYSSHLLVSPFADNERTFPSSFPLRNKVMARLSAATVIVEAGDTSGSLHQAVECVEIGKPLFIAKSVLSKSGVTWPARFKGKPGVHVLEDPEDLVAEIFG
jgi:DNA processing protein